MDVLGWNKSSVALVLNPGTGHVSHQFHVVFDDDYSTVTFMREFKIPPNWTDLVQRISQSFEPDHIYLKDTWFTTDIEKYPRETPIHMLIVPPKNNKNMITSSHPIQQLQESMVCEGASVSEAIERPVSKEVLKTSNVPKVSFSQQSSKCPSGMTYHKVEK